ncbi:putative ribonuclease H-like domain-containing protein [Tanacetum coccineum]
MNYYYFLDDFQGFFQIPIALRGSRKDTFTVLYGTLLPMNAVLDYAMAPAIFKDAWTAIFHDMGRLFEVFMDDFLGFDIEIKDKKGTENLAADHLSRLENPDLGTFTEEEITDEFLDEHLMILKAEVNSDEPCYKVEKALYGLHQAPRASYETLSTYLLENGFRRGTIDKTLFIKKDKGDIMLVQVYVDDIIFGSTKKSLCVKFEQMMHKRFQMSSMGELTFFLGL